MSLRGCLVCVLVLVGTSRAPAQTTTLAWKLEPGQSFAMDRTAVQDQVVEVRAKVFKQQTVSSWRVHFEVLPGDLLRATLKDVQHKVKGELGPGVDHGLADKLQGRQFTLRITPQGRVTALEGYADFVTAAAENQPERARALRALLPEDALKDALADFLGPLPDQAVAVGATWQRPVREPIPHFGMLVSSWHFSADGPSPAAYQVSYTIKTSYQPPAADDAPLFRIVKGSLQGENGRGKILVDVARGRVLGHERRLSVRGTLLVDIMGMQVPLEFTSANRIEIKSR